MAALLPIKEFELVFHGESQADRYVTFKVYETADSRSIGHTYNLVYNVEIFNTNEDGGADSFEQLFTDYLFTDAEKNEIGMEFISDEVAIAWNVWLKASWSYFHKTLVKKWPPICRRLPKGHNQYEVIIEYAPLFIVDFQITSEKTKRYTSVGGNTAVWEYKKTEGEDEEGDTESFEPLAADAITASHTLIGVKTKGDAFEIQGVDVIEPNFSWTERWNWGPVSSLVDWGGSDPVKSYFDQLTALNGTLNLEPFRGYEKECVLFRGATGRYVHPMTWEFDYHFCAKPKRKVLDVFGVPISVPVALRGGWNYVDPYYTEPDEIEVGTRTILHERPTMVKLHRVFPTASWSIMKLVSLIPLGYAHILDVEATGINKPPMVGFTWVPPILAAGVNPHA